MRSLNSDQQQIKGRQDDDAKDDHGIICSAIDDSVPTENDKPLETIDIDESMGRTFEMPDHDGNLCKATITNAVHNFEKSVLEDPPHAKFKASLQSKHGKCDEMISCNQLLEHLERHDQQPLPWEMDKIIAHQGPLHQKDPNQKIPQKPRITLRNPVSSQA